MLNKINLILEASRVFSLPMSLMSASVIIVYGALVGGNVKYGILAAFAVCLVHLATNVLDDYFDYQSLIKQTDFNKQSYLKNAQKTKCRYIVMGLMKPFHLLILSAVYLGIAGLIGLFFVYKCGYEVLYFALVGGIIAITYSFLSKIKLSEVAIGIVYGPALYGGIYFVMAKNIVNDVFILSLPTMFVTLVLLYIHTVMDYDFDINENHKTIANSFKTKTESLVILKYLLTLAYISPILLCIFDILDWQIFLVYITIPLATDLYNSLKNYTVDENSIPQKKWYHFPMENMMNAPSFMFRMYQSRNLMIYYSLFLIISIVLALS